MAERAVRGKSRRGPTPAVGDAVRVPADTRNDFVRYEHSSGTAGRRQPIDGLILSIREISSGQPVKVAAGDLSGYVFDLLHDNTFDPRFAAKGNAQGAAAGHAADAGAYARVRQVLKHLGGRKAPVSGREVLAMPALQGQLDGWRVVRVRASTIEVQEAGQ